MKFTLFTTPKEKMAWVLSLLAVLAIAKEGLWLVPRFLILFATLFVFEFIFWKIRGVRPTRPTAGVVSTLIIFLLADPVAPLALAILAVAVAMASKQFLRPAGRHIFNPAATGLLAASLFGLPVTWWGVSWGFVPLVAVVLGASYVSILTIRQHRIILPFILTTIILSADLFGNFQTALNQLLVGSFWFFSLVMLPEPQTAAKLPRTKIFYGILVGVLQFFIANLESLADPLLVSLLIGNLTARVVENKLK